MKKTMRSSLVHNLDRISSLHDSIRLHILSFLPMKDAIRTSSLSKSWEYVSSSLSKLEFDELDYNVIKSKKPDLIDFKDMVDQMLFFHNDSDIETFKLFLNGSHISDKQLHSWISLILGHNVQELCLRFTTFERLPPCLFTCSTLKVLNLNHASLGLPTTIRFPLLKSLILDEVFFCDINLRNKLLSSCSCPVLEYLSILSCYNQYDTPYTVSLPNLHKIEYDGTEPPRLSSETLSSLSDVNFIVYLPPTRSYSTNRDIFDDSASKILMGLHNVEKLTLDGFYMEFLTRDRDLSRCLAFSFYSLRTLQICMYSTENQVQAATLILRTYPNLETLSISFSEKNCSNAYLNMLNMEEYWHSEKLSSRDISKHLKVVEIVLSKGYVCELDLLGYLLVNAKFLEKMSIKLLERAKENLEKFTMLSEKLLTFTQASPSVAISFS